MKKNGAANYSHYRGLETISRGNGADRILFASGYPVGEPGASVANLFYSDLSERVRNKIASGNIQRLISAVRSGSGRKKLNVFKAGPSRFKEESAPHSILSVRNRKPIPWGGAVDMHGHYGRAGKFPIGCVAYVAAVLMSYARIVPQMIIVFRVVQGAFSGAVAAGRDGGAWRACHRSAQGRPCALGNPKEARR